MILCPFNHWVRSSHKRWFMDMPLITGLFLCNNEAINDHLSFQRAPSGAFYNGGIVKVIINNLIEMERFADVLSEFLSNGTVLAIDGDLGAGKTTLTKFLVKKLGYSGHVTSPTFQLVNRYEGDRTIYHLDLYRIESIEELEHFEYEEYIYPRSAVTIIEWANHGILPDERIAIEIRKVEGDTRIIEVWSGSENYERIGVKLKNEGFSN